MIPRLGDGNLFFLESPQYGHRLENDSPSRGRKPVWKYVQYAQ